MIELYNYPLSVTSQKVRLCLLEKELGFEDRIVDLTKFEHLEVEYLRLNPAGVVPTLVHDGQVIVESSVINEYLEDAFPRIPLLPADSCARATVRLWSKLTDDVLTGAVQSPTFAKFLQPMLGNQSPELLEERISRMPNKEYAARWRRMAQRSIGEEEIAGSYEAIEGALDQMEAALAGRGPWLIGDSYTLADVSLTPFVVRVEHLGRSDLWEKRRPHVAAWLDRVRQRPSFEGVYASLARLGGPPAGS